MKKITYTETKTEVMANGQWVNFQTGSNAINGSTKDLETIYNLLVQAEQAKLLLDIQIILVILIII
jgi:hypothetical protein